MYNADITVITGH